jgi:hypothetical protein
MMKLISINSRQFSFSKYLIYFILMGFLLKPLINKVWYAITFNNAKGVVKSITFTDYQGRKGKQTNYYPVVDFIIGADTFTCYGSSFQHDGLYVHDSVSVIYNPKNPNNAYVYSFLGSWAPKFVYIIPFSLILSLGFLGIDSIPENFVIKF